MNNVTVNRGVHISFQISVFVFFTVSLDIRAPQQREAEAQSSKVSCSRLLEEVPVSGIVGASGPGASLGSLQPSLPLGKRCVLLGWIKDVTSPEGRYIQAPVAWGCPSILCLLSGLLKGTDPVPWLSSGSSNLPGS